MQLQLVIPENAIPELKPVTGSNKNKESVPTFLLDMAENCVEFEIDDSPPEALVKKYSNKPTESYCIVRVKLVQGRTPIMESGHLRHAIQDAIDAFQIFSTSNEIQFLVQDLGLQIRQWMMKLCTHHFAHPHGFPSQLFSYLSQNTPHKGPMSRTGSMLLHG